MRILTRYILGEVTSHALIGTAIFTFVIYTRELGQILELIVRNSAPLPSAIELFLLIIPEALTITLPAGVPGMSSDIGAYVTDTSGGKGNRHAAGY